MKSTKTKETKMAPLIVVAIVAAGLFGTGTVIKPVQPAIGTTLQIARVGTLAGGAIGAAAGTGSALAVGLGTNTFANTVAATAIIGGGLAGVGTAGFVAANANNITHGHNFR